MKDNQLEHRDKFEALLNNYKPSETLANIIKQVPLVLLVAPVAGGRNTIIKELLASNRFQFLVSDTSRRPRYNNQLLEQDGKEYWFKSEQYILEELELHNYLSPAIIHQQQVSGIHYREFERLKKSNLIGITDIDIQGSDMVYAMNASCKYIFIVPPSYAEWMRRFNSRGAITKEERVRRLNSALMEIKNALDRPYFHFLVNDQLSGIANEVINYVLTNENSSDNLARQKAREILEQLKADLI